MKKLLVGLCLIYVVGCATGYQSFYTSYAPEEFEPTENLYLFAYEDVDINELYELLYSDYYIIGKSSFIGEYETPSFSTAFAKSLGADIFISTIQFKETRTALLHMTTPTISTTTISGYSSQGSFSGFATSYGTKTTTLPIRIRRYKQEGLFLKNINNIKPLWKKTKLDFSLQENSNTICGIWKNDEYTIEVVQSNDHFLAFIFESNKKILPEQRLWEGQATHDALKATGVYLGEFEEKEKQIQSVSELKFIINIDTLNGIYIMGDITPQPANVTINKFGYLEIDLTLLDRKISFKRN